jgi:hypothetical protein
MPALLHAAQPDLGPARFSKAFQHRYVASYVGQTSRE